MQKIFKLSNSSACRRRYNVIGTTEKMFRSITLYANNTCRLFISPNLSMFILFLFLFVFRSEKINFFTTIDFGCLELAAVEGGGNRADEEDRASWSTETVWPFFFGSAKNMYVYIKNRTIATIIANKRKKILNYI